MTTEKRTRRKYTEDFKRDAVMSKLAYIVKYLECWPEVRKAGRDHIMDHYDIHKLNDQLLEVFQSLLSGCLPGNDSSRADTLNITHL